MILKEKIREFSEDRRGNMAMMAAISMTVIVIGAASAIDYTMATNNRQESQNIADSLALAAAMQVKRDGTENLDSKSAYAPGRVYTGTELGLDFAGLKSDTDVTVEFVYNLETQEVTAIVKGQSNAGFMRMAGVDGVTFSASSTVGLPGREIRHPASIALVIDNSNSMWWDDTPAASWDQSHYDAQLNLYRYYYDYDLALNLSRQIPTGKEIRPLGGKQRMDGVKEAIDSMNEALGEITGGDPDQRFLRMGLAPFNDKFLKDKASDMAWGFIPDLKVNAMEPSGATDVSAGLQKVENWMKNEPKNFDAEIRDDLRRYIILMTDGQDTSNSVAYVPKPGSQLWRGEVERGSGKQCKEAKEKKWLFGTYMSCVEWESQEEADAASGDTWMEQNRIQPSKPTVGRKWKEVEKVSRTKRLCDGFKDDGYEVYTVAYALQPGVYYTNLADRDANHTFAVSPEETDAAKELLEYCATTPDHFLTADDTGELTKAFEEIGETIADDTAIRIKS